MPENNDEIFSAGNGDPDIEDAFALLSEEKYTEAIDAATPLMGSADGQISSEAEHIVALSNFHLGNFGVSKDLFEKVAEKKDDTISWFNVMTSAVLAGDAEKGESAFKKALEANERSGNTQQPSQPMILYYYACALNDAKMFGKALEYLNALKNMHVRLKITDDTFVYMRGVPFFRDTLGLAKKIFGGMDKKTEFIAWLDELEKEVDDEGKEAIRVYKMTGKPE